MNKNQLMLKLLEIIDTVKTGILSSIDSEGVPHLRWMSPCILSIHQHNIYAITSPHSKKAQQVKENPEVEWMFQNKALDTIINVRGRINIIDNPSLKTEIVEKINKRLNVFWKVVESKTDFFVIETIIESATYFEPMKGHKEEIKFI